ncbi:uncharacterized protein LOC130663242 [Microplitis mediator]|uniref:uncharacterized protein LOC130663242 n=1 Tax=Microplitis mediator TaxID=375433 RepID=UPI0025523A17|nr:uncharacterized protein LOC130663242 [Microplitis mediator]
MGSDNKSTPNEVEAITVSKELAGGDILVVTEQATNKEEAGSNNSKTSELEEEEAQTTADLEGGESEKASEGEGKAKKKRGRPPGSTNKGKLKEGEQQILNFLVSKEMEKKENRSKEEAGKFRRITRSSSAPKLNEMTIHSEGRQTAVEMSAFFTRSRISRSPIKINSDQRDDKDAEIQIGAQEVTSVIEGKENKEENGAERAEEARDTRSKVAEKGTQTQVEQELGTKVGSSETEDKGCDCKCCNENQKRMEKLEKNLISQLEILRLELVKAIVKSGVSDSEKKTETEEMLSEISDNPSQWSEADVESQEEEVRVKERKKMKKKRSKQGRSGDQERFRLNATPEGGTGAEKNTREIGAVSSRENRKVTGKEARGSGGLAIQTADSTRKDASKKRGEKSSSERDNTSSDGSFKKRGSRKQYGTHAAKETINKPGPMAAEEWSEEFKERSRRRNTIYMWGDTDLGDKTNAELEGIIKLNLGEEVRIEKSIKMEMGYVIHLDSMKTKLRIMAKKSGLRGKGLWVDDDLTERQAVVLQWLEAEVTRLRRDGQKARRNYMKVELNNEWWVWDEIRGDMRRITELQRVQDPSKNAQDQWRGGNFRFERDRRKEGDQKK